MQTLRDEFISSGADGWKIVSAASNIELDGCEPEVKEKQ